MQLLILLREFCIDSSLQRTGDIQNFDHALADSLDSLELEGSVYVLKSREKVYLRLRECFAVRCLNQSFIKWHLKRIRMHKTSLLMPFPHCCPNPTITIETISWPLFSVLIFLCRDPRSPMHISAYVFIAVVPTILGGVSVALGYQPLLQWQATQVL